MPHSNLEEAIRLLARELGEIRERNEHSLLHRMDQHLHKIMATQAELAADLKAANTQLRKLISDTAQIQPAVDALKAKIVELEALVAAGGTIGQELVDAVAETKTLVQTVDDNVPEQVPPVTPPEA